MPLSMKKAENASTFPSSEAVDAYKTYLQKALPTYTVKDFAAGALIPVDQVEKDIMLLENKIGQYHKFDISCEKEEQQLEILKTYKANVKGKHWPKHHISQLKGCSHAKCTYHTTPAGVKMAMCMSCGKPFQGAVPPVVDLYYDHNYVKNLKAKTASKPILQMSADMLQPVKKEPKQVMLRAGRAEVEQKFIMRMGMASNCNVSINQVQGAYYGSDVLFRCDKCNEILQLKESALVTKENGLPSRIEEFCVAHRHDAKAENKVGRLFQED